MELFYNSASAQPPACGYRYGWTLDSITRKVLHLLRKCWRKGHAETQICSEGAGRRP